MRMRPRVPIMAALAAGMLLSLPSGVSAQPAGEFRPVSTAPTERSVIFEANRGQWDRSILFVSRGVGSPVILTRTGVVVGTRSKGGGQVRMTFAGVTRRGAAIGVQRAQETVNYFMGKDPRRWTLGVPTFQRIVYRGIYPHVDLAFYGHGRTVEYDWILHPGAHLSPLALRVKGAHPHLDGRGALHIGTLLERPPVAFVGPGESRATVAARYVVKGSDVRFAAGRFDHRKTLTIDPTIEYSTYQGGSSDDRIEAVTVDDAGHAYVAGRTGSVDFPNPFPLSKRFSGETDAFIAEFDAAGVPIFTSYLGGAGDDEATGIALGPGRSVYVCGRSTSIDFPTFNAPQQRISGGSDGFLARINVSGTAILWNRYVGGSKDDGLAGLAVDSAGNAWVAGSTRSSDVPGAARTNPPRGGLDALVAAFAPGGGTRVATYLGGSGDDTATGVALDPRGAPVVVGTTTSADFPGAPSGAETRAFIAQPGISLSDNGVLSVPGTAAGVGVDAAGRIYLASTTLADGEAPAGASRVGTVGGTDVSLTVVDPAGTSTRTTIFGGSGNEEAGGIAVQGDSVYLAGTTSSSDLPQANALQSGPAAPCSDQGCTDAFVTRFSTSGEATFSTYLGGHGSDSALAVAADTNGIAYVGGQTGSSDFPTRHAVQKHTAGGGDAFLTKITTGALARPQIVIKSVTLTRRIHGTYRPADSIRINQVARWTVRFKIVTSGPFAPQARLILQQGTRILFAGPMLPLGSSMFHQDGSFRAIVGIVTATFIVTDGPAAAKRVMPFRVKLPKFTVGKP